MCYRKPEIWGKFLSAGRDENGVYSSLVLLCLNLTQSQPIAVVRFETISDATKAIFYVALTADDVTLVTCVIPGIGRMEDAVTWSGGGASTTGKQLTAWAIGLLKRQPLVPRELGFCREYHGRG